METREDNLVALNKALALAGDDVAAVTALVRRVSALDDSRRGGTLMRVFWGHEAPEVLEASLEAMAACRWDRGRAPARQSLKQNRSATLMAAHLRAQGEDPLHVLRMELKGAQGEAVRSILEAWRAVDEASAFEQALEIALKLSARERKATLEIMIEWVTELNSQSGACEARLARQNLIWEAMGALVERSNKDDVQERALEASWVTGSPMAFDLSVSALRCAGPLKVRLAAAQWLAHSGNMDAVEPLKAALPDAGGLMAQAVLESLRRLVPEQVADLAMPLLERDWVEDVRLGCEMVARYGREAVHREALLALLTHNEASVRVAALGWLERVAPQEAARQAKSLLTGSDERLASDSVYALRRLLPRGEAADVLMQSMSQLNPAAMGVTLRELKRLAPGREGEIFERARKHSARKARQMLVQHLHELDEEQAEGWLVQMSQDAEGCVRKASLRALLERSERSAVEIVRPFLDDYDHGVRSVAVRALEDEDDAETLEALLRRVRDPDASVRLAALGGLYKFDDPRVFSELVSSLNDVNSEVREMAESILEGTEGAVPSSSRMDRLMGWRGRPAWKQVQTQVQAINQWAVEIGHELLGRPVVVHQYRQGLGRTHEADPKTTQVIIEVSDTPVTSGAVHGAQVMMGLALHELGHHLCDIGVRGHKTMRGVARSEKFKDIYDILIDERLERTLRSRRPEWGVYFDRLASYAFAQGSHRVALEDLARLYEAPVEVVRQGLEEGSLPGRLVLWSDRDEVWMRDADLLATPGAVSPLVGWLWCLRCGFDPRLHPDPRVAEAVARVPGNLKSLKHSELIPMARDIARLLEHEDQPKGSLGARSPVANLGGLRRLLARMKETNLLPEDMIDDAPDIRKTPKPDPELQVVHQRPDKSQHKGAGGRVIYLGDELDFPELELTETLHAEPAAQAALVASVRKHVRRLRAFLERLGRQEVVNYAQRRGRRLDLAQARKVAYNPGPNLLVHSREEMKPDAYIGLLIDRSGSMCGDGIQRARAFGALLTESAKGLRGLEGHVNAFDDDTFYELGDFQRHAISALSAGGGNNDAGALWRAAQLAAASGKRHKMLIMISDGLPSQCTFGSLAKLVQELTRRHGIVCAQAAVEPLEKVAFPHYVDLSSHTQEEAVARFGRLLMRLTQRWR